MRQFARLLKVFVVTLFCITQAIAQDVPVSGTVRSANNTPLEGVTIRVGNNSVGRTNAQGQFNIRARKGQTLSFSFVGFQNYSVVVGDNTTINVTLQDEANQLEEVVVAMDIKRKPRELGFATQTVTGDEVKESQRENFVSALQGRVAGLTINQTGGMAGASSQIVLRGFNSLSLDNSPLFVVDGVILDNSTVNETSNGGSQLGLARDLPNRGNDYTNRISDLNPNDIASITVLKGPEATALYGSQASSGAIVITTKKAGTTGQLRLAYDNSFRVQKMTRYHDLNDDFDNGTNGVPQFNFTYFGPAYPANTQKYDNVKNFFRNGFAQTHNLSADFGTKNVGFRLSGSLFDQQSPIPTNTYKRYNGRISNTTKIGKWLEIMPSFAYTRSENDKPLRGLNGYLLSLYQWPADNDIRDWEDANGMKKPLYNSNPNADIDNPFYNVYKNRSKDFTNRYTTSLGVNLNPTSWLSIAGRFSYDTYRTEGWTRYDSMSFFLTRAQKGLQDNYYRNYYGYNHTITATARKTFGDFNARLMVGNMWQDYEYQQYAVSGTNLKSQSRSDSDNTDIATRIRLSNALRGQYNYSINRQVAYFGEFSLGWKNMIFATYTHRFEESSIFPKVNRNYNYPAGSLSVILSDLVPGLKSTNLNYWKLRGSLASTARSSAPYANQSVFNQNTGSGGGFYYAFTNSNPFLRPEKQSTYEIGTELKLLQSRLGIDVSYYNTRNRDLIVENFRASYGTGFVLNTLNVGSNKNTGIEIAVDYNLLKTANTKWDMRLNFNKMKNEVTSLPSNVPEFYISDTWLYGNARGGLVVGGPTTSMTAYGYLRNSAGQVVINAGTGLPVIDQNFRVRGDRNPDFTLGWLNNLSYKNFKFSMLWDLKVGGDVFNGTEMFLTRIGRSTRTADRLTPRVVEGVLQDGLENTTTPTKNNIAIIPYFNQAYYTTMPEEEFIQKDVNWFRLRDLTISYTFGNNLLGRAKWIRSLSAFVTGNDLILLTNYTGADPAVNGNTAGSRGVGAFGFDYGNVGTPISVNFGIKASF